jgi:peptidoglycan/LPS O-acetylase OafA/YrhL
MQSLPASIDRDATVEGGDAGTELPQGATEMHRFGGRLSGSRHSAASASRPIGFVSSLESLRGIAALMVAAFHARQARLPGGADLLGTADDRGGLLWSTLSHAYIALANGHGAVIFFFVLSGFVLALSLERGPRDAGPSARRFFPARVFRLYPAVISTVLIFAAAFWVFSDALPGLTIDYFRPSSLLRNMLLIDVSINGVMWTLQLEVIAAPLIFATVLLQRRWNTPPVFVLAVVLLLLSFSGTWIHALGYGKAPLGPLYAFVFGILVHSIGWRLVGRTSTRFATVFFMATAVVFFAARPVLGFGSRWSPLVESAASACIILILAYGKPTILSRSLDSSILRMCGKLSYSFYLLHPLTLMLVWNIPMQLAATRSAGIPGVIIALGLAVGSSIAIMPLAWLSWRFIELPGIALGRRLTTSLKGL